MPDMFEGLESAISAAETAADEAAPPPAAAPPPPAAKPAEAVPAGDPAKKPSEYANEFLKLTKSERAARERQTKAEQDLKTAEPEIATGRELLDAMRDPKKALEVMKKHGLSLRQLQDAYVSDLEAKETQPAAPVSDASEFLKKLAQVESELANVKNERVQERIDGALQKLEEDIHQTVQSDDFEQIQAEGDDGLELVKEIIFNHHAATLKRTGRGEILPTKKAAELAEKHFEAKHAKALATKKMQARFAPKPAADDEETKTLGGSLNAGGGGSSNTNAAEESFEQFIERKFG